MFAVLVKNDDELQQWVMQVLEIRYYMTKFNEHLGVYQYVYDCALENREKSKPATVVEELKREIKSLVERKRKSDEEQAESSATDL